MKNSIAAMATVVGLAVGQTAFAAENDTAKMPKQVIVSTVNEAASSGANWVLPLMILVMVAASVAGE